MNNLLYEVFVLFFLFNGIKSLSMTVQKPLLTIAQAISEVNELDDKKLQTRRPLFPELHKKQSLLLSSPSEIVEELLRLSSSGPVEILREEQIRNAKNVVEKIQNALRASPCRKGAIKVCRKACKQALKRACSVYKCRSSLKSSFKKQCKANCNSQY